MSRLYSGYELLRLWEINPIQLYKYVRKGDLTPLNALGKPTPHPFQVKQSLLNMTAKSMKALQGSLPNSQTHNEFPQNWNDLDIENQPGSPLEKTLSTLALAFGHYQKRQHALVNNIVSQEGLGWKGSKLPNNEIAAEQIVQKVCDAFYSIDQAYVVDQIIATINKMHEFDDQHVKVLMEVGKEALELYEHIVEKIGATDKTKKSRIERRETALEYFKSNREHFTHLIKNLIDKQELYNFNGGQSKRGFMSKLFKSFWQSYYGQSISGIKLWDIYNKNL